MKTIRARASRFSHLGECRYTPTRTPIRALGFSFGFAQLIEAVEDMMLGPSIPNTTGITLHCAQGWRPNFSPAPYDVQSDSEFVVVYKEQILEQVGDGDFDARAIAQWIADNVVKWAQMEVLTRTEIEAHLA